MRLTTSSSVLVTAAIILGLGCGTSNDDSAFENNPGGLDSGTGGGTGTGGGGTQDAEIVPFDASIFDANGGDMSVDTACSASEVMATRIPTDIVILLDKSGSMTGEDAVGTEKFDAVEEAINAFLSDPASADLGVGLQFFPLNKPNVPTYCTNTQQCGAGAPCSTGVCYASVLPCPTCSSTDSDQWIGCDNDSECPSAWLRKCTPLGLTSDKTHLCFLEFSSKPCFAFEQDRCLNALSCDSNRYRDLSVPVQPMSTAGSQISAAMASTEPLGSTPTYAALSGAIAAAQDSQAANPTHNTVVLFATDGLPTSCEPKNIPAIAQLAANAVNGTPSIMTFVIGIFTQEDLSYGDPEANLNQIAAAGGTNKATIIAASTSDVVAAFLEQLEIIRGKTLGCEYTIPEPEPGSKLNYKEVNVEYTPGGGSKITVPYVEDSSLCTEEGGWYYDVLPSKGVPSKIILCPASCDTVQSDSDAKINFALGCLTQGPA